MRIYWDENEVERVVNQLVHLRLAHPEPALTSLLREAQLVLPSERRRKFQTVPEYIVTAVAESLSDIDKLDRQNEALREALRTEREAVKAEVIESLDTEALLATVPNYQMLAHLAARFEPQGVQVLNEHVSVVRNRFRVAVGPLKGSQPADLAAMLPAHVEIYNITRESGLPNADLYILWAKFSDGVVKSKFSRVKYVTCTGGLSQIAAAIKARM